MARVQEPRRLDDAELENAVAQKRGHAPEDEALEAGYQEEAAADPLHMDPRTPEDDDLEAAAELAALEMLNALGGRLAGERNRAVDWRQGCGIEQVWLEDNDAYEGIDDLNRGEEHISSRRTMKPIDVSSPASDEKVAKPKRSNAYLNITAPYCDGAAARVGEAQREHAGDRKERDGEEIYPSGRKSTYSTARRPFRRVSRVGPGGRLRVFSRRAIRSSNLATWRSHSVRVNGSG